MPKLCPGLGKYPYRLNTEQTREYRRPVLVTGDHLYTARSTMRVMPSCCGILPCKRGEKSKVSVQILPGPNSARFAGANACSTTPGAKMPGAEPVFA